jgi:flagellar basal-body rod modification protein FlgD
MSTPISAVTGSSPTGPTATITTPAPAGASATSSTSGMNDLLDPQAFLRLLVAQLQYQDPSNPVDTSSFLNQTAMLSQVQSMDGMSSTLNSLATAQQTQAATGLIGKQITYLDDGGIKKQGVVGSATLSGGTATLLVGGNKVALDKVLEVSNPPTG